MKRVNGFTLLELVIAIVLLGIVSVGVGGFIKFGSHIFVDVTNREEMVGSARFAIERLNREIRAALPNSIRVISDSNNAATRTRQCLEFIPAAASAVYKDIPVSPENPSNTVEVIKFDRVNFSTDLFAVVYPLSADDLYGGSVTPVGISSLPDNGTNVWTLTLNSSVRFAQDSPTTRLYFVDYPVNYCVSAGRLTRHQKSGFINGMPTDSGVLMAEQLEVNDIDNPSVRYFPFTINEPTRLRNAILTAEFRFEKNDERVTFNNEIQVMNVP